MGDFSQSITKNEEQARNLFRLLKKNKEMFSTVVIRNVKRFLCSFCDYSSPLSANVKRHVLQHTGERPFHCSYCSKGFIEKKNLITHMLRHTGERPFSCSLCGKGFTQKRSWTTHMLRHCSAESPQV
ncbi:Zinc finger protein Xfin [Araneus ventricosus]|uniref:Zinc finger protein Xfin n=1 Tax=Araneus ventricosus TaxID=182803 RepID=A0A4Y2E497_ARAVE|nr:Zinc finger protein Xfin [Araneus ventricosus]